MKEQGSQSQQTDRALNRFERHPKITIACTLAVMFSMLLLLTELGLRYVGGLGDPVLYDSSPLYGFRLLPNQKVKRFGDATIKVNNLGLRTDVDWDDRTENKILLLGNSVTYGGSYISNEDLFSSLAVKNMPGFQSGNAGVNGWGVENIHGLIVETNFLPAQTYVTVLVEEDFYRGMIRMLGQPYWCVKPGSAIRELLFTYYFFEMTKRYVDWQEFASVEIKEKVVEKAVTTLKKMDDFLVSNNRMHLIYISPTKAQVLGLKNKDDIVFRYLKKHNLRSSYIVDRIKLMNLSEERINSLFHDSMHLEKSGHVVWAQIVESDLKQL